YLEVVRSSSLLRGRLGGEPLRSRTDVTLIQTLGNGQHQMLRIVVTRAVLPGAQLSGEVIGVLPGNSRKVRAHTLVVRAMAALARHDVALPVAHGREFFAVGQLVGAGLFSALAGPGRE